jgi:hypothetical protein
MRENRNQFGVSPSYRNYCQPATGTASANCRPGTGTTVSSIYRDRTNSQRPERRSTDGQVILKRTSARSEGPSDLLLCGAPLRNRTVDLLLTIDLCCVLSSQLGGLTCVNTSTDRHLHAPDRPSRALFATQSATHIDPLLGKWFHVSLRLGHHLTSVRVCAAAAPHGGPLGESTRLLSHSV